GSIFLSCGCYYIYKNIVLSRWLVSIGLFLIAVGKLNLVNSAYSLTKLLKKAKILQILINYAITVILLVLSAVEADWYTSHIDAGDSVVAHPQQFIYPAISVLLITLVSLGYLKHEPFRKSPRHCWTLLQYVPHVIAAISQKHRMQHTDGDSLVTDNGSAGRDEIQETSEPDNLPSRPRSSTKEEEGQQLLHMVPMCMAFLASGLVYSIGNTFFLDQAKGMDTRIGKSIYKIPLQGFLILANVSSSVTRKLYTAMVSNSLQGSGEKYSPAIEYAIGMVLSALCCTAASWIAMEVFQQKEAKSKISAFILTPQFLLFGAMDGLARDGIKGFFTGQLPDPIKGYAVAFTEGMIGAGSMFAIILVLVTKATTNWFNDKEGKNRVDKFYHLLTVVAITIFLGYTLVAVKYPYQDKAIQSEDDIVIQDGSQPADGQEERQEEGIKQETDTSTDGENKVEEDSSQIDDHRIDIREDDDDDHYNKEEEEEEESV
ncbi:NRT1/ PTR FAMILY 5.5 like, partial [Thalictrum thalictroides]